MKALFLWASCSMTVILLSVSPSVFSWSMLGRGLITLDSRYMAKISAAAYLRMRLISEYIRYLFLSGAFGKRPRFISV